MDDVDVAGGFRMSSPALEDREVRPRNHLQEPDGAWSIANCVVGMLLRRRLGAAGAYR
jgi:hypothetical protein